MNNKRPIERAKRKWPLLDPSRQRTIKVALFLVAWTFYLGGEVLRFAMNKRTGPKLAFLLFVFALVGFVIFLTPRLVAMGFPVEAATGGALIIGLIGGAVLFAALLLAIKNGGNNDDDE